MKNIEENKLEILLFVLYCFLGIMGFLLLA